MLLCQLVARFTISLIQFLRSITFKSKTSHFTNDASRHPETSSAYVSPSDILPFQKAGPRRRRTLNRRKGSTRILTDTPVGDIIAAVSSARAKKKAKPGFSPTKRNLLKKPRELVHDDTSSNESKSFRPLE